MRLRAAHGLTVEPLTAAEASLPQSVFTVDSVITSPRAFQGHHETRLTGRWSEPRAPMAASGDLGGYVIVRATGRLGPLATYLLEPESDDGLVDWNFFDASIKAGRQFPVIRLYK